MSNIHIKKSGRGGGGGMGMTVMLRLKTCFKDIFYHPETSPVEDPSLAPKGPAMFIYLHMTHFFSKE